MHPTSVSAAVGRNIRAMRRKHDISTQTIADSLGISADAFRHYERGERSITVDLMIQVASVLNCSVQSLLAGADPRQPDPSGPAEYNMLTPAEHQIFRRLATEWDGDLHALIVATGLYASLPPDRRRDIIMDMEIIKDQCLASGALTPDQLPPDIEYMQEALGKLYDL